MFDFQYHHSRWQVSSLIISRQFKCPWALRGTCHVVMLTRTCYCSICCVCHTLTDAENSVPLWQYLCLIPSKCPAIMWLTTHKLSHKIHHLQLYILDMYMYICYITRGTFLLVRTACTAHYQTHIVYFVIVLQNTDHILLCVVNWLSVPKQITLSIFSHKTWQSSIWK